MVVEVLVGVVLANSHVRVVSNNTTTLGVVVCTCMFNIVMTFYCLLCSRIFPASLMAIYEYHCDVLKKLESRLLHWKQQDILGDIFGKFSQTKHVSEAFTFSLQPHYVHRYESRQKRIPAMNRRSESVFDVWWRDRLFCVTFGISEFSMLLQVPG